jgi:hypothetical protein
MYVYMYVCMYVCMYLFMYVCMYFCMYELCRYVHMHECKDVNIYVRMRVPYFVHCACLVIMLLNLHISKQEMKRT